MRAMVRKEGRELRRARRTMGMLIALPILLLFLAPSLSRSESSRIRFSG